jgi:tetratricopeptide (TPR) repeat protein
MLRGGPALVLTLATLALGLWANGQSCETLRARYAREADRSLRAKDDRLARLCLERLVRLDPREANQMLLAQTLERLGNTERAREILEPLAPLDRPGNYHAQLWIAQRQLAARPLSAEAVAKAEAHLTRAVEANPRGIESRVLLGQLYLATGRRRQAIPHLVEASTERPALLMVLADTYQNLGQPSPARERAREARVIFRQRTEVDPDDLTARLLWAWALLFLDEHDEAQGILEQGLARREDPRLRQMLAQTLLARADALARESPDALESRLLLVEQGLRHEPGNADLLTRLSGFLGEPGEPAARARDRLEELLAQGRASGTIHFLLGQDAYQRGRFDEAQLHWEAALQHSPGFAEVANNLAWLLAQAPEPDLERALALVNLAIGRRPDLPPFRGTRGHVLARLRRWREALPDLEAALQSEENDPALRRDLAATYEALGMTSLARKHQSWLDQHAPSPLSPIPSAGDAPPPTPAVP